VLRGIKNKTSPEARAAAAYRICPSVSGPIERFPRYLWLRKLALLCCSYISPLFRNVAALGDALSFDRLV
jgi:hypothetical protein